MRRFSERWGTKDIVVVIDMFGRLKDGEYKR